MSKQNLSEELEAHQLELENERRRLQEKDSQLASVQECLQKQLRGSEQDGILLRPCRWCPQILSGLNPGTSLVDQDQVHSPIWARIQLFSYTSSVNGPI